MSTADNKPKTKTRAPIVEPFKASRGRRRYRGRVWLADGSRARVDVPEPRCFDAERARLHLEWAQEHEDETHTIFDARQAARTSKTDAAPTVDVDAADRWFDAWEASRVAKGLTSTRDNRGHWREHIKPALGPKHVRDWTAEDMRALVAALDGKVRAGAIEWKTAVHVWTTVSKMAADAVTSKVDALRCRDTDPTTNVEGPDRGEEKSKPFLYPSEFLAFISCEAVPLRWRRAVALAVYLYPRDGELRILRWEDHDLDLDHGAIHIHRAWDRRVKGATSTKSGRSRRFSVEAALLPLLRAMHAEAGGVGPVVDMPSERDMARGLRRWLLKAGVTRPELHTSSRTTRAIRFHDLRATGLTWMAVRGDEPLKIMQRAGHTNFATTQLYVRTAEAIREGFGEVFPPLPPGLGGGSVETPAPAPRGHKVKRPEGANAPGTFHLGFPPST